MKKKDTTKKTGRSLNVITFEQVPIEVAQAIAAQELNAAAKGLLSCRVCGTPVALESCKTDEHGKAVHDECYIAAMKREYSGQRAVLD